MRRIARFFFWFAGFPLQRWRLLRLLGARQIPLGLHRSSSMSVQPSGRLALGSSIVVGRRTRVSIPDGATLKLGSSTWIGDDCEIGVDSMVAIGDHTSLQHRSIVLGDISIGAGCLFGPNFYASSSIHRFEDVPYLPIRDQDALMPDEALHRARSSPISIGEDCWIGINVVVSPGVTVGRGCVIGANSVVTRDLPPYSIAAGAPAKVLRKRHDFYPPPSLQASNAQDIPYFYSGFEQYDSKKLDANGTSSLEGWRAQHEFVLAMSANAGDILQLHVEAACAGKLTHGAQNFDLSKERLILNFQPHMSNTGFLNFKWSPATDGSMAACHIVVIAATMMQQQ